MTIKNVKPNDTKSAIEAIAEEIGSINKALENLGQRGELTDEIRKELTAVKADLEEYKKKNIQRQLSLPGLEDEKVPFDLGEAIKSCRRQKHGMSHSEAWKDAGLELEAIQNTNKMVNKDVNAGTGVDGGFLLSHQVDSQIIPLAIANRPVLNDMGITKLTNLGVGSFSIPKQTQRGTAYWIGELSRPAKSNQKFDRRTLTAKKLAAYSAASNDVLRQGRGSMSSFISQDLSNAISIGLETALLTGSGLDNGPKGIINYTGLTTTTLPSWTNGGQLSVKHLARLMNSIMVADLASGNLGFVTNPIVYLGLQLDGSVNYSGQTENKQPYIQNMPLLTPQGLEAVLGGPKFRTTNLMPVSDTFKLGSGSNQTGIIYGDFSQVVIGFWTGGTEIKISDVASDGTNHMFLDDGFFVHALTSCDITLRDEAALTLVKGCNTTGITG